MKRIVVIACLLGLAVFASALSSYLAVFKNTYKPKAGSELSKAACMTCHTGKMGGKLNPYGLDVQKALKGNTSPKLTEEYLKKIEKLDSDKDGKTNIEEIKAGTLPGVKGK